MKFYKNFLKEKLFFNGPDWRKLKTGDIIKTYRGTDYKNGVIELKKVFLSTSVEFSKDYGSNIYEINIKPKKVFNSLKDDDYARLFDWVEEIHDSYNGLVYSSYEELIENNSNSDTWEIIESEIDTIFSEGYDAILITEGGIINFIINNTDIITSKKIIN